MGYLVSMMYAVPFYMQDQFYPYLRQISCNSVRHAMTFCPAGQRDPWRLQDGGVRENQTWKEKEESETSA